MSLIHVQKIALLLFGFCYFQNTPPPLHKLKKSDIDSVGSSFQDRTITVHMKSGITYVYNPRDWDMEEYERKLDERLRKAIRDVRITFTKVEINPEYPGGESSWQRYLGKFCRSHTSDIEMHGPGEITVQFIVHLGGQVTDIEVLSNPGGGAVLYDLAKQAIQESGVWTPAVQNGRIVVAYRRQVVRLAL